MKTFKYTFSEVSVYRDPWFGSFTYELKEKLGDQILVKNVSTGKFELITSARFASMKESKALEVTDEAV